MTNDTPQPRDYRGTRAIVLLRVSTEEQEKHFGFPSQLQQIREKLIEPLKLKVDPNHIIEDTYTGLEFKEREALARVLALADQYGDPKKPILLVSDRLDRIGRKGLQRELYRAQLREKGVSILTTDPAEHSDDDSLMGEMIRYILGFKAELELNDIRRRTMNGKRAKVAADKAPEERKLVGTGTRRYGYSWTLNAKHKRDGFMLNEEVIKVDEDGNEWTEVTVVRYIFELADQGTPIRQIAKKLNDLTIPTMNGGIWQSSTVANMLKSKEYAEGYAYMFKERSIERVPGKKYARTEPRPEEEQIKVAIPQIIEREQYERVQERLTKNKKFSSRRNQNPQQTLLRVGIVRCAACGGGMSVARRLGYYKDKEGPDADKLTYQCNNMSKLNVCQQGCTIDARELDQKVWEYTLDIMRNPVQIDTLIQELASSQDGEKRRRKANRELAEIKKSLATFRKQLADLMIRGLLDRETEDFLTSQLQELTQQEDMKKREIYSEESEQKKLTDVQIALSDLHKYCKSLVAKIDDPEYTVSYDEMREALEKLGISAYIYKKGNAHRIKRICKPPCIVSILS